MKPAPRLFSEATLGEGPLQLDADQARYLGSVLRLKPGDEVRIFGPAEGEWLYTIASMEKRRGAAEPSRQLRRPEPLRESPVLLFAPVKRTQTEFIVQKATEMGAVRLQPVITDRTNREKLRLDRLTAIATEAAEQSERLDRPLIEEPLALFTALKSCKSFVFCDEAGDDPAEPWGGTRGRAGLAAQVFPSTAGAPEAVLIGPEGGFTSEERERLRDDPRAVPVSLGPRILRAETAAIAALTLWQLAYGDLGTASEGVGPDV